MQKQEHKAANTRGCSTLAPYYRYILVNPHLGPLFYMYTILDMKNVSLLYHNFFNTSRLQMLHLRGGYMMMKDIK